MLFLANQGFILALPLNLRNWICWQNGVFIKQDLLGLFIIWTDLFPVDLVVSWNAVCQDEYRVFYVSNWCAHIGFQQAKSAWSSNAAPSWNWFTCIHLSWRLGIENGFYNLLNKWHPGNATNQLYGVDRRQRLHSASEILHGRREFSDDWHRDILQLLPLHIVA